jgi:hypothetical protein
MRLLLTLVVSVSLCAAETPPLPEPYLSIVALARSTPPELAADAMLRVLESGQIADKDAARDLAEEAFELAGGAHFPVRRRAFAGSLTDTRQGYLNEAYALKLDALSLQTRAVRVLLAFDKQKARELFLRIPKPALAPLTCDDALVYEVADFYQALALIVDQTFNEKERKREDHVSLLIDYVSAATSPPQFAPLARVIQAVTLTAPQREAVIARYNAMLESVSGDDRSFFATLDDLSRAVVPGMAASFKKYEERNLSGARCEDSLPLTRQFAQGAKQPDQILGRAKLDPYWQSGSAKRLLTDGRNLRFGLNGESLTEADRAKPEWLARLTDYLAELADWSASGEATEADYYHEKSVVYLALVELIPPGSQREKMMGDFVEFVSASDLQRQSPAEWFVHANTLRERMRANPAEVAKVLEKYEHSGNASLALFASLGFTFASDPPAWAALGGASGR